MNSYLFHTNLKLTPRVEDKYYLSDYVPDLTIKAKSVHAARRAYLQILSDKYCIYFSKHAKTHASPLFYGDAYHEEQVGWAFIGKTYIEDHNVAIEVWAEVNELKNPFNWKVDF